MHRKLISEALGTFWLVLGGCGSAVLAAAFPNVGIGFVGVSLAFGLTVLTGGLRARPDLGRPLQPGRDGRAVGRRPLPGARGAAVHRRAGASARIVGAGVLYVIASGKAGLRPRRRLRRRTATASIRPAATR